MKQLVDEMEKLDLLRKALEEVPYERYTQFIKTSKRGTSCIYAKKAIEFYKRLLRDNIKSRLQETLDFLNTQVE